MFQFRGHNAWLTESSSPRHGNPWVWCTEFPTAFVERTGVPQRIKDGFYHVYLEDLNGLGNPQQLQLMDAFYAELLVHAIGDAVHLPGFKEAGAAQGHGACPGMIFVYGPGIAHTLRGDPASPMLKYFVSFVGEAAEQLLAGSALRPGEALQLSGFQEIVEIFELLQREGVHDRRFGPRLCAALLPVLIIKIDEHALSAGTAEPRALETYQRTKRILEQRFMELRTAGEAAAACHIDSSYLCRLFRRFAHTTPYRFIIKLKMDRAAEFLLDERMRVKEAAAMFGFADPFHFSHTFKRVHGISPERFVRRSRGIAVR